MDFTRSNTSLSFNKQEIQPEDGHLEEIPPPFSELLNSNPPPIFMVNNNGGNPNMGSSSNPATNGFKPYFKIFFTSFEGKLLPF